MAELLLWLLVMFAVLLLLPATGIICLISKRENHLHADAQMRRTHAQAKAYRTNATKRHPQRPRHGV